MLAAWFRDVHNGRYTAQPMGVIAQSVRTATVVGVFVAAGCVGCRSRAELTPHGGHGGKRSEETVTPSVQPSGPAPAPPSNVPPWAVGMWSGEGTSKPASLALPGNQGVQLAWLKDKGTDHVGVVQLRLRVKGSGLANGELSGALGALTATGTWQEGAPLHLDVRAPVDGSTVFHGTLTLSWPLDQKRTTGRLRATSGDGRFLRSADLEVTVAPDYK